MKFGLEIELTACRCQPASSDFVVDHDGSVHDDALELRTPEPLNYTAMLERVEKIAELDASVDTSCGVHVHVSNGWTKTGQGRIANAVLAVCALYEERLFSCVPPSRRENSYCRSIRRVFFASAGMSARQMIGRVSPSKQHNNKRYCWINLVELYRPGGLRTVEIRLLGNTSRVPYIQTWVTVCALLVRYAEALAFNRPLQTPVIVTQLDQAVDYARRLYAQQEISSETLEEFFEISRQLIGG